VAISLIADLLEEMKHHRFAEVQLTVTKCRFHILDSTDDIEILEVSTVPMALKMLKALREGGR
jgi:hypothetical protein